MTEFKKILPILIVIFLTIPATISLLRPGLFTMHDDQQIVRLAELDNSLSTGQFPVRWVQNLGFGYGYPLFNFYPPFVYYLGETYHLLFRLSFINSTKLVFATAFFAAAAAMYLWVKKHFGSPAAIIAALFYTYTPYHAVDAYVRGALAELFAFVWPPLILLSIDKLLYRNDPGIETRSKWSIILTLSYAALMLTHNLIVLPFTLILGIYLLLRFLTNLPQLKQSFLILSSSLFLALGLTTFFWLPALTEKQHTLVDNILLSEKYTYSLHYVEPWQLWNSLWGYAGSAPLGEIDGFSLKIGKLHLALAFLVSALTIFNLVIKPERKISKSISSKSFLILSSLFLLVFSAFMTTQFSSFIWDNFPPLQYLQFPWRLLTFTALFSSFLTGASVWLFQQFSKNKTFLVLFSLCLIIVLLLPNLKLFHPQTYLNVTDSYYTSDQFTKWKISKTSFEFVPKDVATTIDPESQVTQVAVTQNQIATTPYTIISGKPSIKIIHDFAHLRELSIDSPDDSIIQINTFNFPGWQASIDDQPTPIDDSNPLKLIRLHVPSGSRQVKIVFTNTFVRKVANTVSLLSFLTLLLLFIKPNHPYVKPKR